MPGIAEIPRFQGGRRMSSRSDGAATCRATVTDAPAVPGPTLDAGRAGVRAGERAGCLSPMGDNTPHALRRSCPAGLGLCHPFGMTINATASSGAFPGTARQTDSYVIAVLNQKGGVGKTMVTLSLAAHTAAANGRALVVDVDPQANAYDLTKLMDGPGY